MLYDLLQWELAFLAGCHPNPRTPARTPPEDIISRVPRPILDALFFVSFDFIEEILRLTAVRLLAYTIFGLGMTAAFSLKGCIVTPRFAVRR
jgi:hypothetical protein